MSPTLTFAKIVRHLDDARAEAAEFEAAGCYALAACRRRDAAYLEGLLSRFAADTGRQVHSANMLLSEF